VGDPETSAAAGEDISAINRGLHGRPVELLALPPHEHTFAYQRYSDVAVMQTALEAVR
jgi:hypothetical protein